MRCAAAGFSSHTGEIPAGGKGQRERTIPCVLTPQKQVLTATMLHLVWKFIVFVLYLSPSFVTSPSNVLNFAAFGSRRQKHESWSSFIYSIGEDWLKNAVVSSYLKIVSWWWAYLSWLWIFTSHFMACNHLATKYPDIWSEELSLTLVFLVSSMVDGNLLLGHSWVPVCPTTERRLISVLCFRSCPPQPVLWASSSGAQRDSAPLVQDSATPPPGEPRSVCVVPDTCVQSPTLLTLRAPVSVQKNDPCVSLPSFFLSISLLQVMDTVSAAVVLWCYLANPPPAPTTFVSIVTQPSIQMRFFCDRLSGEGRSVEGGIDAPGNTSSGFSGI